MEILEQMQELNFLEIAGNLVPEEKADVYFYILNNKNINITKTVVADFKTWIFFYNHYDNNTSLIVTGATPLHNSDRYTLVKHLVDVEPHRIDVMDQEETPAQEPQD